jgi:hypothetical protein
MSAFMIITRSWPSRGRTTAARPTAAADATMASPAAREGGAATTGPAATPAPAVGDQPVRSRPDDVDRPILRRLRRYRSDGVLGLRWLA